VRIIHAGRSGDIALATALRGLVEEPIQWEVSARFGQALDDVRDVRQHYFTQGVNPDNLQAVTAELKAQFPDGVTPAPYMNLHLLNAGCPIGLVPPRSLGLDPDPKTVRPIIAFTEHEAEYVRSALPKKRMPRVMLETRQFSNQSPWHEGTTITIMRMFRDAEIEAVLPGAGDEEIALAVGYAHRIPIRDRFNYREVSEVYNHCDAYVGCASGAGVMGLATRCRVILRIELLRPERRHWSSEYLGEPKTHVVTHEADLLAEVQALIGRIR
jgi:hypothetical protein